MPVFKRARNKTDSIEALNKKNKRLDVKVDQLIKVIKNDRLVMLNFWRILRDKEVVEHLFKNDAESLKRILDEIHKKNFKEDGTSKKYQSSMSILFRLIKSYINKNEDIKQLIEDDWALNKHLFIEWGQTGRSSLPIDANYDWFDSHNTSKNTNSLPSVLSLFKRTALVLGFDNVTHGVIQSDSKDKVAVTIGDGTYNMSVSGSSRKGSVKWLNQYLDTYIQKHASDEGVSSFLKIAEATKFFTTHYNRYSSSQAFYDRCKKGELTYMTSGCTKPSHAVGIAIYGDYLIYCNRGYGLLDIHQGTKIYKLKKGINSLDLETIRQINETSAKPNSTIQDLHTVLNKVVDLNNPIASLPSKGQEHGNCAFANPKATTEAMLVLLQNKGGDEKNIRKIVNAQDRTYEKSYKDFSKHIRDTNTEELIAAANASNTPQSEQVLLKLIKECFFRGIMANTRTEMKTKDHEDRLLKLWDGIPETMRSKLTNDDEMQRIMEGQKNERWIKLAVMSNQTDLIKDVADFENLDMDKVFEYAIKWNREHMIKSLLSSGLNGVTVNPGGNVVTARLKYGNESIEDIINKIDSEGGLINLLNTLYPKWWRNNDQDEANKLISLVRGNEHSQSDNVERIIRLILNQLSKVENTPTNTTVSPEKSIPLIKEMYNIERNTSFLKRNAFTSTFQNAQQEIENPVRVRQITMLQSMFNQVASANSHDRGNLNLILYCMLRYMIEEIHRENNKLPSALEKVCNILMSRMEKDPTLMKEMKDVYSSRCKDANVVPLPDSNIKDMQGEHLKTIGGFSLEFVAHYIKTGEQLSGPAQPSDSKATSPK